LRDPRDVDGQRVVAVDPERRGVDDDIEAGEITEGTGVDGQVGAARRTVWTSASALARLRFVIAS
jgi:hypothetical protein